MITFYEVLIVFVIELTVVLAIVASSAAFLVSVAVYVSTIYIENKYKDVEALTDSTINSTNY